MHAIHSHITDCSKFVSSVIVAYINWVLNNKCDFYVLRASLINLVRGSLRLPFIFVRGIFYIDRLKG